MCRIAVGPTDRFRVLVVASDVASDLAREVWDRCEDPTREEVALDLGKPELHLIQPGRVGRREVQMDARMGLEKRLDALGLVGGQVVDDDVNVPPARLPRHDIAQEFHEGFAGVARHRLADDLAGARVERGIQRQSAVPVVLEPMRNITKPRKASIASIRVRVATA